MPAPSDPGAGAATATWHQHETDRQRRAILAAADRLLAGTPRRSTGRLSVVQLAAEAGVKYWIVAQKHTDLRDHFQQVAREAGKTPAGLRASLDARERLDRDHADLRRHCSGLEELVQTYALVINELTLENQQLKAQLDDHTDNIVPLSRTRRRP
jgi:hypothetical protein